MNVVQRIGRAIGQARHWSLRHVLLVGGWILALTVIEIRGRKGESDLADALVLFTLFFVLVISLSLDFHSTAGAIKRTALWVRDKLADLFARRLLLGLDLRQSPAIAPLIPLRWRYALAVLIALNAVALVCSPFLPAWPRVLLHDRFYLGYLAFLVSLWLAMGLSIFITGFVAWGGVHDYFVTRYQGSGPRDRRAESYCMSAGMGTILLGIILLPEWAPLALLSGLMLIWTLAFWGYRDGFQLLWKRRDGDVVRAVDGCFATWLSCVAPVLIVSLLILLARGHILTSLEPITPAIFMMPITTSLGVVLSWTVTAAMAIKATTAVRLLWLRRGMSARHQVLPVLHLAGAIHRKERQSVQSAALAAGWRVRFSPAKARATDVKIQFCHELVEGETTWPLPVTMESLADPRTWERLARRHEIQARRIVLNGLERILKRAARLTDPAGTGSWIGLQHWFILGLSRDKESDFTQDREATAVDMIVGPPYHTVIPLAARRHFQQMLSALAIDMIFVEDGVSFRRLVRVLRVAFELYDVHAGQRRAEERDFNGLPGVRVMLHDISIIETTHQVERGYPEPDYEDLGRARILHVFKDREEHEEWEPLPWETDDVPLLSGR